MVRPAAPDDDDDAPPEVKTAGGAVLRIDKWLWHARFLKTRSLASRHVGGSGVRVNGTRTVKPAASVRAGDVLTFALNDHVRVIKVLALGARRGPAPEAQALYTDLAPPAPRAAADPFTPQVPTRDAGTGRPTKRDRRAIDRQQGD
ncbi:MAG: ribosome-associated heat shock protein Hsp15 [Paracoccaceae bacterium]